jgi:NhaA family Na+:H+ antiporter
MHPSHASRSTHATLAPPLARLLRPFQEFAQVSASSGLILLFCTAVALLWANSPWSQAYTTLWHIPFEISLSPFTLRDSLVEWIDHGLMTVFFFVAGLEIKRELLIGELASFRQAALPMCAALGGMIVPATLYLLLNAGTPGSAGWGIPMATDIAFALGILALLGTRVPIALKVFLTALAIVDDLGAVLVIAVFYTTQIAWGALAIGGGLVGLLIAANRLGIRHPLVYGLLTLALWLALLQSGVYATIAGVIAAMTIPARARMHTGQFVRDSQRFLETFQRTGASGEEGFLNQTQEAAVQALETACEQVQTPMQRLEHVLHPWVTFAIMPLFALANAGVSLGDNMTLAFTHATSLGIILGLVIGKQVGITAFAWFAVRSGLAALPYGVTWGHIYGVGWLGGIGFTMSIFVASLGFGDTALLPIAKLGILTASLVAGIVGWGLLRRLSPRAR